MKKIHLSIDSLRLAGFRPEDRFAVAEGIKRELARALAEPGMAQRAAAMGRIPVLRLGRVQIQPGAAPRQVGTQLGRVIGRRMGK